MLDVLLYGMLELALDIEHGADNPYDPLQVLVDVELARPDGTAQRWPAYYDGQGWMFRYRALQPGEYSARILLNEADAGGFVFHVEPSGDPGPIRVDGWGFRHLDGAPFVPLGLNLGWSAGGGVDDYERWFSELEEHGGSFARIWFTHFTDQDPEWPALGTMDTGASGNIDAILDAAWDHGVLLMPVLWQHSELESSMWSSWDGNPYNSANGGPCADSACFFEDEQALAHQAAFLRYAVARWGAHPALAAWEIMNELDGVVGVDSDVTAAWAGLHAETLRALEDSLHPVSFSYSLPPQAVDGQRWEGADFTQVHSYLLSDVEPVVQGVAASLERYEGPVLVGEWGLDWFGNGDRDDREGLAWHNASWAAVASGSAGNALTWWWDDHVEPDDLWWRLQGLATITRGLDLPAMAPTAVTVSDADLEAFGRSDGDVTLVWVHVTEHTVPDPDEGAVVGATIVLDGAPAGVRFFDTRTGEATGGATLACDGVVHLPEITGDLAVVLDADGFSCDEPSEGCGCAAQARPKTPGLVALLGLLGLSVRRRRE